MEDPGSLRKQHSSLFSPGVYYRHTQGHRERPQGLDLDP